LVTVATAAILNFFKNCHILRWIFL
jgi:hypothetical protein